LFWPGICARRRRRRTGYDSSWKVFNPDGSVPDDRLRLVVEQAKGEAKITRDVALSEVADLSSLREAQSELGLRAQ